MSDDDQVQAPVEPADDVKVESSPPPADEAKAEPTEETKPKKEGGVAKRIRELTYKAKELERKLSEAQEAKPEADEAAPDREKFEDYEAYMDARAEWVARKASRTAVAAAEEAAEARLRAYTDSEQEAQWITKVDEAVERLPDYVEVTTAPDLTISNAMAGAIRVIENGPDVAYHLGKNPEVASKIYGLDDVQQAIEIGRLSERIRTQPKPKSAAPDPITPGRTTGAVATDGLSDKMSIDAWMKARIKQVTAA